MEKPLSPGRGWVAGQAVLMVLQISLPFWWTWLGLGTLAWGFPFVGFELFLAVTFALAGVALAVTAILTLGRNLTAVPQPKVDSLLVTHGPYQWIRHPIYSALVLIFLGWALAWKDPVLLSLDAGLCGLFVLKSRLEERWLAARYPEYVEYRRRTGGLIPRTFFRN